MSMSRFRPSPALVISMIALFVSIGGIGYAAATIGTNDIKKGAVTTKKLHKQAVSTKKIKAGAVTGGKVEESTLGQVPNAAELGGNPASAFLASNTYRNESALGPGTTLGDGTSALAAGCNPGDVLLSGGPANISATTDLLESYPDGGGSWTARINKNGLPDSFSVVVICADQ